MSDTSKSTTPPAGQASFKIDNWKYYMTIDQSDPVEIGDVSSDINGVWPPSDYMIQKHFPNCAINYPLKTTDLKTLLQTFQSHSGFASSGDGNTFFVDITTNAPTMFSAFFYLDKGRYYMSSDKITFSDLGAVISNFWGVVPPPAKMMQAVFKDYWFAEGEYETNQQTAQFINHTLDTSKNVFMLHVFIGPQ